MRSSPLAHAHRRPDLSSQPSGIASIMNYVLHVVRGRAEASTIKLMDGVNSIGRHDDCLIRIRSSQVSRRHCELFEQGEHLMIRDLGSANGTFVNGSRVLGQQRLKPADVITIGGVTLRVELIGAPARAEGASAAPKPAPHDTAEMDAIPVAEEDLEAEDEEFEIAIEDEPDHIDLIPLDDEAPPAATARPAKQTAPSSASERAPAKQPAEPSKVPEPAPQPLSSADEEDAVAQFLLDLKLDEED
jgi:predicted component of type VI protein secretion system